jgi:flagellar biogenesis protein FliO
MRAIQHLTKCLCRRRRTRRKLQLLEIQQLGEKRFVAIVRVGKQKFLIGGAATSVSLLAEITAHSSSAIASRPQESA